jgi:putative spermidine/putrescine transport system permease protein
MLIYQQAMQLLNWPFAAAVAIILLLVSLVLVTFYSKISGRVEERQAPTGSYSGTQHIQESSSFWDKFSDIRYEFTNKLSSMLSKGFGWLKFLKGLAPLNKHLAKIAYAFILLFIIMPLPVVILSSFSESSMITFPPMGFSFKWYTGLLERIEYIRSFLLSLRIAFLCVVVSLTCGTLASLALVRYNFRGKEFMKSLFLSPLMLPAVIVGISLLRFLVAIGWVATFQGILLAHLVLTTAYVVRTVSASLIGFDNTLEDAARDLGANALYTFRYVTLPLIKPGLIVAGIFAFIVSFDETTVSMFITGGRTITLSVRIFSQLEYGLDPTVTAISSLLILMAVGALFVIGKVFGLEKFSIQ